MAYAGIIVNCRRSFLTTMAHEIFNQLDKKLSKGRRVWGPDPMHSSQWQGFSGTGVVKHSAEIQHKDVLLDK